MLALPPRAVRLGIALVLVVTSFIRLFVSISPRPSSTNDTLASETSASISAANERNNYAYCTFLAAPWDTDPHSTSLDHYFVATRMLVYQMLYEKNTKSEAGYPFVVLVTEDVPHYKREILQKEGAIVKEVGKLEPLQHETRKAWQDVLTKLRLFEMIEYEKVAFFDSDTLLTRSVDAIFDDPAAQDFPNLNLSTPGATRSDEAPQPETYLFASNAGSGSYTHAFPPTRKGSNLNAGIVVFRPSIVLFNYYFSLTSPDVETRYNGRYPEQGLWAYAHRRHGNMPWKQLDWRWNTNFVNDNDLEVGIASLHTKWWDVGDGGQKVRDFAMSVRWRMEGWFEAMLAGIMQEPGLQI